MSSFFYKIYDNTWVKSIRRGLLKVQAIILINCIFIIILNVNNELYFNLMSKIISENWRGIFQEIYNGLNILSKILVLLSINSELAKIRRYEKQGVRYMGNDISPNMVGFTGLTAIIVLTKIFQEYIKISNLGNTFIVANWTVIAIVGSMIFSEVYIKIYYYMIDKRKNIFNSYDKVVKQSILGIVPSIITIMITIFIGFVGISIFANFKGGVGQITIYGNNSFFNDIKYILVKNAIWAIGGHGGDLVVHGESFNRMYVDAFTNMGGAGATICLIIAILLCSKNKYSKRISNISIIPSIFNINEIITYGLPILFNPIYIVPLMVAPVILYIVSKVAFALGLVEIATTNISWTTPILYNAYELTGSFLGVVLQVINIFIGVLIYIPFVKISDNISKKERAIAYGKLKERVFSGDLGKVDLASGTDSIGEISIFLGEELREILEGRRENREELYLEYQPQVNKKRKVVGVEALLRWESREFGKIPPNITVLIAEELGLINLLGKWIIKEAISELVIWNRELEREIMMSINISTKQLTDSTLANYILTVIDEHKVNPNYIKVEITENFAIGEDDVSKEQLVKLSDAGVKLVIDDFGVGYNPLLYIKKYNIDCIKIDGSLIKDIDKNEESKSIVDSVYALCKSTKIMVVSEFVETEEQKKVLDSIGDGVYQGYLFSKPLKGKECIEYIKSNV